MSIIKTKAAPQSQPKDSEKSQIYPSAGGTYATHQILGFKRKREASKRTYGASEQAPAEQTASKLSTPRPEAKRVKTSQIYLGAGGTYATYQIIGLKRKRGASERIYEVSEQVPTERAIYESSRPMNQYQGMHSGEEREKR
ncbi:uncharacterized protein DFL_007472 [Arthrobotrys flagrans]|uniref:Uncharacterized protein n=1 Tax=Arthrobotrys flagrans TaxID=97331 RepID=A0A436ZVW7_ARTFL|nr:hypothetical protein DFL_007472 [Arthrobotrys flagrans]